MRLPLTKHPGILAISVLVIGLLVWGFWPRPVLVELVEAQRAPLTVTIEEEGRTRVIDRFIISAPVDGVACRVRLDVGDTVQAGQTLLSISPLESRVLDPRSRAEAEARVAAARSALELARQQADAAGASANFQRSEIKRLKPLAEQGVISSGAFDKAQMDLLTAEAFLRSANHGVEVARYEQQAAETALKYAAGTVTGEPAIRVPVKSPITGKILQMPHECEGPVTTGQELLVVGDPSAMEVVVDLLSADAVKVKPGMKVHFDRWGGDESLAGRVRTVEPFGFTKISALGVEEQRVNVIADFVSSKEDWERLGDGYRVEARFVIWEDDDVLQVPASSLFRLNGGWALFLVENGRARQRVVKIGQRTGLVAQILEGVEEGDKVVNHPSDEVAHGVRITER
ncbi:MAG: efflux RND transporter periplasmic adaptor subunit [Gammaproteobacteria bacterium]|nr:efflux RND transporter periplasmic adaptor subunit [Gammaproteobacteria bacterium]